MQQFKTCFQHPFEENPRQLGMLNADAVMQHYKDVDWHQVLLDCVDKPDDVLNEFYFFEASMQGKPVQEALLNISGEYDSGKNLEKNGPRLTVRYQWSAEKTSRGFLGMGSPKTKIVQQDKTMEACTIYFAAQCLDAFLQNDSDFLNKKIVDNSSGSGSDFSSSSSSEPSSPDSSRSSSSSDSDSGSSSSSSDSSSSSSSSSSD